MARPGYSAAPWRRVRRQVLERDGYRCQIGERCCTRLATEVDHIVSPLDGGEWYDPANLRAACQPCNAARGGRLGRGKQLTAKPSREW